MGNVTNSRYGLTVVENGRSHVIFYDQLCGNPVDCVSHSILYEQALSIINLMINKALDVKVHKTSSELHY